jgi:hypothetical protein
MTRTGPIGKEQLASFFLLHFCNFVERLEEQRWQRTQEAGAADWARKTWGGTPVIRTLYCDLTQ